MLLDTIKSSTNDIMSLVPFELLSLQQLSKLAARAASTSATVDDAQYYATKSAIEELNGDSMSSLHCHRNLEDRSEAQLWSMVEVSSQARENKPHHDAPTPTTCRHFFRRGSSRWVLAMGATTPVPLIIISSGVWQIRVIAGSPTG